MLGEGGYRDLQGQGTESLIDDIQMSDDVITSQEGRGQLKISQSQLTCLYCYGFFTYTGMNVMKSKQYKKITTCLACLLNSHS